MALPGRMVPPASRSTPRLTVPPPARTPPLTLTRSPDARLPSTRRTPALTPTGPVNVFAAGSTSVPRPALVSPPAPERLPVSVMSRG